MKNILFLFAILVFTNCKNNTPNSSNPIENLKTVEAKKVFLEEILAKDQNVRTDEIVEKIGRDSEESLKIVQLSIATDSANFQKIESYLKFHGYPDLKTFGEDAALAPVIVIHHNGDLTNRNRYFEILYKAWKAGNIDDNMFSLYLNRTHEYTFGDQLRMKSPFTREKQIDSLLSKLAFSIPKI